MNINSPTTNPRVDAFARELALVLRRITGRTVETGEGQDLPKPLPKPNESPRKEGNEHD